MQLCRTRGCSGSRETYATSYAHAAAARFDEPPADLEQRYRVLQEQTLDVQAENAIQACVRDRSDLLVAVLVGVRQLRKTRVALVAETTASFRQLVDKSRNVEAQAFGRKLSLRMRV